MQIDVLNTTGSSTGRQVELNSDIFEITPNDHCIYLAVKQHLAGKRQGTHKTKERNEIAGSRKKLKRQKGTGTARVGDIKNPIFRGGGRIFGPRPKDYTQKLNKNLKRLARKSALSIKSKEKAILVVEDFNFDAPKTKDFVAVLNSLGLEDKKSLFVLGDSNNGVYLSSRNLKRSEVVTSSELSTYKILNANNIVLLEGAFEGIEANLNK